MNKYEYYFRYTPSNNTLNFTYNKVKKIVDTTMIYLSNDRNQSNYEKAINDHFYGKLGELSIWHMFSKFLNKKITLPDFNVRKKKNYEPDLILNDVYRIHVKSQHINSAEKFGLSWMMQKNDNLVVSPSDFDLYCFCLINENKSVDCLKICKAKNIKYGEPKLNKLKDNKVTIYYDDNIDVIDESYLLKNEKNNQTGNN